MVIVTVTVQIIMIKLGNSHRNSKTYRNSNSIKELTVKVIVIVVKNEHEE